MAKMVVLNDAASEAGVVDAATAGALARLGVTSVTVLGDEDSIAVVLEGWAFDPAVAGTEAAAIVTGGRGHVRILRPLLQAAVSTGTDLSN
jgi:hypothetical protein